MKTIKISLQLDYIDVTVNGKINSRFEVENYSDESEQSTGKKNNYDDMRELALRDAKVRCFDLLWQHTEMGEKVEINPYIN